MNLFAAAASFGFIVAIFQWGWGSEMLGIGRGGPIEAFAPVLFFAILFGLSMDYQVFLVSRMHEEWVHSHDNRRAITVGQRETGGIITAAAIIMIAVFGGFVLGDNRVVKLIGLGLASAIFIDAFITANRARALGHAPARPVELVLPFLAFSHNTASLGRAARRSAAARAGAGRTRRATGQGLEPALFRVRRWRPTIPPQSAGRRRGSIA